LVQRGLRHRRWNGVEVHYVGYLDLRVWPE
jgi:hypothetical protein